MKTIKKIITAIAIIGILFVPFQTIASMLPVAPAIFETSLSFPLSVTDTSLTLVSTGLIGGQTLPTGYSCFTIDQGQPNTEYTCGLVSGTTVTNLIRGIDPLTGNTSDANLTFSHRRGADVKITDFPVLTLLRNILNGSDTLPGPISYASGISPVGNQDLTTKSYVLSVVNGGPVTFNQVIVSGVAGASETAGNLVYLKVSDGRWYPTNATDPTTLNQVELGITQGSGSIGTNITNGVLIKGVDTHNIGTAGFYAYASNTPGVVSGTAGTNIQVVGQYITASGGVYFDPYFYTSITTNQSLALAGNGGVPSSTNTYVTQQGLQSISTNPVVITYTSSTTWTKPVGIKYAVVEVQGRGGAGAAGVTSTSGGGGGGGGGYSKATINAVSLLSTESITIGATSSFGSHNSATAGASASGGGGAGGIGSGGDINISGSDGQNATAGTIFLGGAGGDSFYGGSGFGGFGTQSGNAGKNYGGGGGGGGATGGGAGAGGTSGPAIIIVTEYFQ